MEMKRMKHVVFASLLAGAALSLAACGGDKATAPRPLGTPVVTRVNGVSVPTGLVGMTVMIEGTELGDADRGTVYFKGTGGARVAATVAAADWANEYIITTVPVGTAD